MNLDTFEYFVNCNVVNLTKGTMQSFYRAKNKKNLMNLNFILVD